MKRKQFSEERIIGLLKEAGAGAVVTGLCRRQGMSSATYDAWKARWGGLELSEVKRRRALEDEDGKPKRLLADAMLDNAGLQDLLGEKGWRPPRSAKPLSACGPGRRFARAEHRR